MTGAGTCKVELFESDATQDGGVRWIEFEAMIMSFSHGLLLAFQV